MWLGLGRVGMGRGFGGGYTIGAGRQRRALITIFVFQKPLSNLPLCYQAVFSSSIRITYSFRTNLLLGSRPDQKLG